MLSERSHVNDKGKSRECKLTNLYLSTTILHMTFTKHKHRFSIGLHDSTFFTSENHTLTKHKNSV